MRKPHPLYIPAPAVSQQLDNAGGRIVWWAFRETAGAVASFRLWDSSNNAGQLLLPVNLPASGMTNGFPGLHSLPYDTGLYLEVLSGSVEGQVMVISGKHDEHYGIPVFILGDVTVDIGVPPS